VTLEEDDQEEFEGLIKANGEINWDCPCLQGMAYGPCGEQFKAAFSCFHYSEADPKGSDCIPQFRDMQECFVKYPEMYGKDDELDEWKTHILRAAHQDSAKKDIIDNLSPRQVLLIMDWAMKFLPASFRETQRDWFGKKGKSWHVTVAVTRSDCNDIEVITSK